MPHPLLIGSILVGGTLAAWGLVRREHTRLRRIAQKIAAQGGETDQDTAPIRLERDPQTGVYRPVTTSRRDTPPQGTGQRP